MKFREYKRLILNGCFLLFLIIGRIGGLFIPQVHIKEFTLSSNCENQGFFLLWVKVKKIF